MSITDVRMRSDYRLWDRIHVKPTDLNDARHVDNVVYFKWFNHTIGTCLRELGVMDFTHGKLFPFTIASECRYLREIVFPDQVDIGITIASLGRSSVAFDIGIFTKGIDTPSAQGRYTYVYVDRASHRPTPIPAEWRDIMQDALG